MLHSRQDLEGLKKPWAICEKDFEPGCGWRQLRYLANKPRTVGIISSYKKLLGVCLDLVLLSRLARKQWFKEGRQDLEGKGFSCHKDFQFSNILMWLYKPQTTDWKWQCSWRWSFSYNIEFYFLATILHKVRFFFNLWFIYYKITITFQCF